MWELRDRDECTISNLPQELFSTIYEYTGEELVIPKAFGARNLNEGNLDVVQALLTAHADQNARDNTGRTPLSLAEQNGYKEIAALLKAQQSHFAST